MTVAGGFFARRPSWRARNDWLALTVALGLLAAVPARPQVGALPPLPELPLDTYEPAIREPVSQAYEEALAKPDDPARNGILGMVLYAHAQYEFAVPCFERAHALDPGEGRWAYYLGRAQVHLGRNDRAEASLREALRRRPGYLPAQVTLAQCLLEAGREDQSLALYQELVIAHPETAEVHYGLGRIRAARGDLAAAVEHLLKACELYPAFGAAHFALARAYRDRGESEKAREQLALYQKDKLGWPTIADPLLADIVGLRNSATDHLRRGIQLAEEGQLQEAAESHEAALEVDPELIQARINLIRLYGQLDRPEEAEKQYQAALSSDPNLAEVHYNYGVLLTVQQRSAEAVDAFRRAIELQPAYVEAHNNYAYLLMTSGRLEDAARHYRAALETKPDYRVAHFNLARILIQQGDFDEAIEHLQQTLSPEGEETPRYTYALAAAYARAGRRSEALRYMKEARQKASDRGQSDLLSSIDRDLRRLEQETSP